jgi:26S proteasome regulatory subunit (ATPase 3-interacting protein)
MSKKDKECCDSILAYLVKTNRPYSANDIHNNLQKTEGHGKSAVVKALETLAVENRIKDKTYGKQKVYFIDQTTIATASDEDMKQMDEEISSLTLQLAAIGDELGPKENKLRQAKRCMSMSEIRRQIKNIEDENKMLEERLATIKSKMADIDPIESEKVKTERTKLVGEWRKRKRMATNVLDSILDGYPITKKAFIEELGLETDEANDVVMPKD